MNNNRMKFRAWDGCDMIYFDLSLCNSESQEWFDNTIWRNPVMQFTGLYDCNGVEIYEGDIVCDPNSDPDEYFIGHVVFDQDTAIWCVKLLPNDYEQLCEWVGEIKVIGNIHQNPELLEQPK